MNAPNADHALAASEVQFANHSAFRAGLAEMLRRQVFGPADTDRDADKNELLTVSPAQLYATGVLFPQRLVQDLLEGGDGAAENAEAEPEDEPEPAKIKEGKRTSGGDSDRGETSNDREPLNLANEFSPSACGISFRITSATDLVARVTYGTYRSEKATVSEPRAGQIGMDGRPFPNTREVSAYRRTHHQHELSVQVGHTFGALSPLTVDPSDPDLSLHVTARKRSGGAIIVSAMIVNGKRAGQNSTPSADEAYFQVAIEIREKSGKAVFQPIDRDAGEDPDDAELASLELLYRHRRAFALGHGVAADWNRAEELSIAGTTDRVRSATVPMYELKPIKPREEGFKQPDLQLSMAFYFDANGQASAEEKIIVALRMLAKDYADWIDDVSRQAASLDTGLREAAEKNLTNCRECHRRIERGIEVLRSDALAMSAFRLMNRAMLIQQYHTSVLRLRKLNSPYPEIPMDYRNLPKERKWRPFQLAFILMNVASMSAPDDPERSIVDLIWFPTGGGKTEAYLGLAAFAICIERLRGAGPGVTVLMRYTLRLLTAQQFQRASALVLALEVLRKEKALGTDLGSSEISIGLWVGQSLTPNTRADAKAALDRLKGDSYAQNPFQVLQCPWCGVEFTGDRLGYQAVRAPDSAARTVRFICPDSNCRFSEASGGLPILVIDEDIYFAPPTVLIGTVDKFAQIAWDDRVGRIFGIGTSAPPPALIIQDELHLISGPLGTIVGLYETAIDRMCSRDGHVHKVVASTATIRRAHQQCKDLYARNAFEFPPQAVRAGESYFAFEDDKSPGRLYVGFMGSAVKSHQTALVRACSPLLQGVCVPISEEDEKKREIINPYGTMIWYFNSLRELGHAATLCVGDIPEFLKGLRHRLNISFDNSRYIREIVELTSRLSAEEIPAILQQLEIPWRMKPTGPPPVDILLSTNMIAVGVDVPRLGLILMSGQPKSTSEYIQATSRVGRLHPGLVLTVYTQTKSRDRSHYERFVAYHQSLYRHVEPTSVTPFSPQARDRGMRGVLIAAARQLAGVDRPDTLEDHEDAVSDEVDAILARVRNLDPDEAEEADAEIKQWLDFWRRYSPQTYGRMGGKVEQTTLAYPFGNIPHPDFQRDAWPVLTSMRNVDGTCEAQVLNYYDAADDAQETA